MKTRTGFVSNSSSSSFCILGIDIDPGDPTDAKFLEDIGYPKDNDGFLAPDYGSKPCNEFIVVGWDEPAYVGIDPIPYLEQDKKLSEIKDLVFKALASYNLFVKPEQISIKYGEAGNG